MTDPAADPVAIDRVKLFGITIDRLNLRQATDRVLDWALDDTNEGTCRYVVTPNVDHAVMYQHDARLRDAYRDASMVVADGAPLVAVSRLFGKKLPERVAGSDLAPGLIAAADAASHEGKRRLRIFLLGAPPGVADRAAFRIGQQWPGVDPVGTYCPPLGFEKDDAESERILAIIAAAKPDVLLVGLGAPKQELWVSRFHQLIDAKVALCVGATIDFLAGEKKRSPRWMQRCGLEWAHRLASEPRRLAGRYARDAWEFPQLVWSEYRRSFSVGRSGS
jgi:N-acetylglucosaminyldiphosphoundecaprenol N-acetyl-beta-D-mannosaminyltransferase